MKSVNIVGYIFAILVAQMISISVQATEVCSSKQVKVSFALDGTTNLAADERHMLFQFIEGIVTTLPQGSDVGISSVSHDWTDITRFTVSSVKPNIEAIYERKVLTAAGHVISESALAKEVDVSFSVSDFKTKAEIFLLLVSDKTLIESLPAILLKKKIFVIVFGSEVPRRFQDLASSESHVYHVQNSKDLNQTVEKVRKQICKDSLFKCDVDKYMLERSIRCKSCTNVCSNKTAKQSQTCSTYCPYLLLPPRDAALKNVYGPENVGGLYKTQEDNKQMTIAAVFGGLSIIIIIGGNIAFVLACYKNRLLCFARNAPQTNQNGIEMKEICNQDTKAILETGGHYEQDGHFGGGAAMPLLDEIAQNPNGNEGLDHERQREPEDFVKNEAEAEMNTLVLCDPPIRDIKTGNQLFNQINTHEI